MKYRVRYITSWSYRHFDAGRIEANVKEVEVEADSEMAARVFVDRRYGKSTHVKKVWTPEDVVPVHLN